MVSKFRVGEVYFRDLSLLLIGRAGEGLGVIFFFFDGGAHPQLPPVSSPLLPVVFGCGFKN